ncbi:lactadherin-like [Diadema setosum]|uniref:lactadherin-like n=1 Tax=Diadema setosum TaxID=31175 RepID=UPI003B3BB115
MDACCITKSVTPFLMEALWNMVAMTVTREPHQAAWSVGVETSSRKSPPVRQPCPPRVHYGFYVILFYGEVLKCLPPANPSGNYSVSTIGTNISQTPSADGYRHGDALNVSSLCNYNHYRVQPDQSTVSTSCEDGSWTVPWPTCDGFVHHVELLGGMGDEGFVAIATNSDLSYLWLPYLQGWTVNASRLVCRHLGFKAVYTTLTGNYSSTGVRRVGVFTCPPQAANITECYLLEERRASGLDETIWIKCCNVSSCWSPGTELGLQSGVLPDSSLTASSCISDEVCTNKARLHGKFGWMPLPSSSSSESSSEWLLVNLLSTYLVTGIITQGAERFLSFVLTYSISSSIDGNTWTQYRDPLTGNKMVLRGNFDDRTPVKHYFRPPIKGQYIRFEPITFSSRIAVRLELLGYGPLHNVLASLVDEGCTVERGVPLGVADGRIPDDRLTASSTYGGQTNFYGVTKGRLDLTVPGPDGGSWTAERFRDPRPWVKIDIGQIVMVTGVITQGSYHWDNWVTSILVSTSLDDVTWHFVARCGTQQIFPANFDRNTHVTSLFDAPVNARYVKIHPYWFVNYYVSMRFEVLGFLMMSS